MKQRGTQKKPKRPTSRARTTTDTVDCVHSSVPNDTGRKVQNGTANGTSIPVAQAGRMLGLDRRTIRRMCDEGSLQCFATPGGHRRIALADIEAMRSGNADPMRSSVGNLSSPTVQLKREHIEELRLTLEEKKTKMALRRLEDQERERAEQEEAARRAEQNDARRLQREREAEQARWDREREEEWRKQEEFERWQNWIDEQVQFGLNLVPPDVSGRFALQIQAAVEEALKSKATRMHRFYEADRGFESLFAIVADMLADQQAYLNIASAT